SADGLQVQPGPRLERLGEHRQERQEEEEPEKTQRHGDQEHPHRPRLGGGGGSPDGGGRGGAERDDPRHQAPPVTWWRRLHHCSVLITSRSAKEARSITTAMAVAPA